MINKGSPLKTNHLECIFMCLLSVCISFFFNKYLFNSFAHFSIELSFCYWIVRGFLIHSGHWVLTRYMTSKYFLTFWRLTFYFLGSVLWCIIFKKFQWSSLPLFFCFLFWCLCFCSQTRICWKNWGHENSCFLRILLLWHIQFT